MSPRNYVSGIFGASPVAPLQQHMGKVLACANALGEFVEVVLSGDWDAVLTQRSRITELENEADDLKREIRLNLPDSLFMPVPRADILSILLVQDGIANRAKDISGLIVGRQMKLPPPFAAAYVTFVKRCVDTVTQAHSTVNELDELFVTGFRGAEVKLVEQMLDELDRIESDTDRMQIELRATLFGLEKDLPPVDVMFYYKITDLAGELANEAQRVGARLQLLLAK